MLDTKTRKYVQPIFDSTADWFIKRNVSATKVTILALIVGLVGSILFIFNLPILSIGFLWVSGFFDVLDGSIARKNNSTSKLGGFLDIVFDRVVEIAFLIAFCIVDHSLCFIVVIVLSAIILSMTIFLTSGALIENNGVKSFHYQTGVAERTEGFIAITLAILFFQFANIFLIIFAVIIFITIIQRFVEVVKYLKGE